MSIVYCLVLDETWELPETTLCGKKIDAATTRWFAHRIAQKPEFNYCIPCMEAYYEVVRRDGAQKLVDHMNSVRKLIDKKKPRKKDYK